jgi:hypothetical protein
MMRGTCKDDLAWDPLSELEPDRNRDSATEYTTGEDGYEHTWETSTKDFSAAMHSASSWCRCVLSLVNAISYDR